MRETPKLAKLLILSRSCPAVHSDAKINTSAALGAKCSAQRRRGAPQAGFEGSEQQSGSAKKSAAATENLLRLIKSNFTDIVQHHTAPPPHVSPDQSSTGATRTNDK